MISNANLQERKLELIQWLSVVDDVSLLEKIADLKDQDDRDWWNDISDDEKNSIRKGLEDAESGKLRPHTDAKEIYEKWL